MPHHSTSMESAMDQQSNCWMWIRRKLSGRPHLPCLVGAAAAASDDSWEKQAFAEDSADGLGGCIWPPRSYSCSFCRREFRSAQALGGHMNVHRRDRARLKLSPVTYMENYSHPHQQLHHHNPNPCSTMASQYPPQVCALKYGTSPNLRAMSSFVPSRTPLSPSRVSVASTQESLNARTFVSPSFSATSIEENNNRCLFSTPLSLSNQISLSILTIPELKLGNGVLKAKNIECGDKRGAGMVEEALCNKRRRLDLSINPFLKGSSQSDGNPLQSRALGLSVDSPIMELDLELRLGDWRSAKG